jgi:hypothetical protein
MSEAFSISETSFSYRYSSSYLNMNLVIMMKPAPACATVSAISVNINSSDKVIKANPLRKITESTLKTLTENNANKVNVTAL